VADVRAQTRLAPSPNVIAERIGEQVVMLDLERDIYLRLNATGSVLWGAIEASDHPTVGELADRLVEATGIERDRALADATAFADDLMRRDAVTAV
jgi:hypothetical protein